NDNQDVEIGGEREAAVEVGAVDHLHSGKAQESYQRARLHAAEPGDRAAGHGGDPRHGKEGPASGGDREVRSQIAATWHPGTTYEFIDNTSTQEVNGKEKAGRTRHGLRHGQDFYARPQGTMVPRGRAADTRV